MFWEVPNKVILKKKKIPAEPPRSGAVGQSGAFRWMICCLLLKHADVHTPSALHPHLQASPLKLVKPLPPRRSEEVHSCYFWDGRFSVDVLISVRWAGRIPLICARWPSVVFPALFNLDLWVLLTLGCEYFRTLSTICWAVEFLPSGLSATLSSWPSLVHTYLRWLLLFLVVWLRDRERKISCNPLVTLSSSLIAPHGGVQGNSWKIRLSGLKWSLCFELVSADIHPFITAIRYLR